MSLAPSLQIRSHLRGRELAAIACLIVAAGLAGCNHDEAPAAAKSAMTTPPLVTAPAPAPALAATPGASPDGAPPAVATAPAPGPAGGDSEPAVAGARPKEVSQDVLHWLQLTPEKTDSPAKPDRRDGRGDPNAAIRTATVSDVRNAPAAVTERATESLSLRPVSSLTPETPGAQRAGTSPPPPSAPAPTKAPEASAPAPTAQPVIAQANPPVQLVARAPSPVEPAAPLVATATASQPAPGAPPPAQTLKLISRVQPEFPREAMRNNIPKGHVRVRLSIASDGSVTHVEILESQPRGTFDRSVLTATQAWRYAPIAEPATAIAEFDFHRDE